MSGYSDRISGRLPTLGRTVKDGNSLRIPKCSRTSSNHFHCIGQLLFLCARSRKDHRCRQPHPNFPDQRTPPPSERSARPQSAATESMMFNVFRSGTSSQYLSQNSSGWDTRQGQLCLDPTQATLVIRPRAESASANPKSLLAPKQGLGGGLANSRGSISRP